MKNTLTCRQKAKDRRLQREYQITLEMYNQVLVFQNYGCYICGHIPKAGQLSLAVDHSHFFGDVRGLLCMRCNKAIAMLNDSAERASRAAEYLTNNPFTVVFGRPVITAPGRVGTKKRAKLLKKLQRKDGSKK